MSREEFEDMIKQPKASFWLRLAINNRVIYTLIKNLALNFLPNRDDLLFIKLDNLDYGNIHKRINEELGKIGRYFIENREESILLSFLSYSIYHGIEKIGGNQKAFISSVSIKLESNAEIVYSYYHINLNDRLAIFWADWYSDAEDIFESYKATVSL